MLYIVKKDKKSKCCMFFSLPLTILLLTLLYCKLSYRGTEIKRMDWYTITSIDWNTGDMYLFRQPAEDEVGGRPVTIHFKLISKGNHRRSRR